MLFQRKRSIKDQTFGSKGNFFLLVVFRLSNSLSTMGYDLVLIKLFNYFSETKQTSSSL